MDRADWIVQGLENLLTYTVKYSPRGRIVRVQLEQRGETVQICVAGQGMGMGREQVERIFDKYPAPPPTSGSAGLGMSTVRF